MHIQTDLIEQQCETSGPADYFPISAFLLSCLTLSAHTCHTSLSCCCYSVRESDVDSSLLRFNLERKVRMDSTRRRCLGHCLIVNLTQHVLNAIKGSQQIDRQKMSLGDLKVLDIF